MRWLLTIFLLSTSIINGNAQCSCTDCPISIISNATQSSFLDISGATNGTLGSNGQQLCQICVHFFHDAVQEVDFFLIAPDGSSVQLIEDTGIAVNDNITFDICFVSCDQSANPDSGFPDVFDSDAGYMVGQTYDGSYYPSIGCLEDLTGDVNGTWELEMTDNIGLDDGELFDWFLVFADNNGTGCGANGSCGNPPSCLAEGGELEDPDVLACEGSGDLVVDFDPSFPNNNEPPAADYDYTYVIINLDDGVIEDINDITDLTSYPPGDYQVCGLSFLIADEPLIPNPDGSYTIDDLSDDIDDELFCADLSDECVTITIETAPLPPNFVGPTTVCVDQINVYEILDYDPDIDYIVNITSGTFSSFSGSEDEYEVAWLSGPGEICALIESPCGDVETCIQVEVEGDPGNIEIEGELVVCPEAIEIYTPTPSPVSPEYYDFTVTNGTIISQTDDSVTIEWDEDEGNGEICAELLGGLCAVDPVCEEIEIELDYEMPNEISTPDLICVNTPIDAEIPDDTDIIDVIWTVTDLNILDGQGTPELLYDATLTGFAEICVEIVTECTTYGPLCQDVEVIEFPEPEILQVGPLCEFEFEIEAISTPGNEYEWVVLSGPGNVDFSDDDLTETFVTVDEIGIYTIQFTETNEANCEAVDVIDVEILDGPDISELSYDCNIDMEYMVTFTILSGNPPFTVNGQSIPDDVFVSEFYQSEEVIEFTITDDFGCETMLEAEHECPCISFAGTMQQDILAACAADNEPVQGIHNNDEFLDGDDIGIYILHDSDDDNIGNILDTNSSGEFFYSSVLVYNTTYYISYIVGNETNLEVDIDDPCLSVSIGQPVIFYDNPELDLQYEESTCETQMTIDGSQGNVLTSIFWSQLDGPGMAVFNNPFDIPVDITFSETGSYLLNVEYANEACLDFQDIEIDILAPPDFINITENCSPTGEEYIVSFTVEGGNPPFTSSIDGSFNGSDFTSEPLASGDPYLITITDADGCQSNPLSGNKLCDCISNAGIMDDFLIEACGTNISVEAFEAVNDSLDANDTAFYFLHTSSINTLGEVIDSNTTGIFMFQPGMFTDQTYYISYVVGDSIPNGIDLLDPCLDITSGQPVIWTSIPDPDAGTNINLCESTGFLDAQPPGGFWSVVTQPAGTQTIISNISDPGSEIALPVPGEYILEYRINNGSCSNADSVTITRNELPEVISFDSRCSNDLLNYDLTMVINGGNGPYQVEGITVTDTFTASGLTPDSLYDFEIISADNCTILQSIGPVDCSCITEAGTVSQQPFMLCDFEPLQVDISNFDFTLDENDTLIYVLHDGDEMNLGQILRLSAGEDIMFDDDLDYNTNYYLSLLATSFLNGMIDYSDPCLDMSKGVPVIWEQSHNIDLNQAGNYCAGEDIVINLNTNGPLPIELEFTDLAGNTTNYLIEDNSDSLEFNNVQNSVIWSLTNAVGACIDEINISLEFDVQDPAEPDLADNIEICNNPLFGSSIALSDIISDETIPGEWSVTSGTLTSDSIDFSSVSAGIYDINFSTIGFENPCPGGEYMTSISVIDCQCPFIDLQDNITLCNDESNLDLTNINNTGFDGIWSLNNFSGLQSPPLVRNDSLIITNASEGNYILSFTINDSEYPEICESEFIIDLYLEQANSAGTSVTSIALCEDNNNPIDLSELLEGADADGVWFYDTNPVENIIDPSEYPAGNQVFEYVVEGTSVCPADQTSINMEVIETPQFTATGEDVSCFGLDDGYIVIEAPGDGETYLCYLNDIILNDGKLVENLEAGDYEVYIENSSGCQSETIILTIDEPEPVTVSLGEDQTVTIEDVVTIKALVNILESDIDAVNWEDINGILPEEDLTIQQQILSNNTISITIVDENGCIATDVININVTIPDIYVPNIFMPGTQTANDRFGIDPQPAVAWINEFYIYDRWGNNVFIAENLEPGDELGYWNGLYNNQPAVSGVYVYYLDLVLLDGSRVVMADDITLVR